MSYLTKNAKLFESLYLCDIFLQNMKKFHELNKNGEVIYWNVFFLRFDVVTFDHGFWHYHRLRLRVSVIVCKKQRGKFSVWELKSHNNISSYLISALKTSENG